MNFYYATHHDFERHYLSGYTHPERPERIRAVWEQMAGLRERFVCLQPERAPINALEAVHNEEHLNTLAWIASQDNAVMYDHDTYALPESYDIARLGAGAVMAVVDGVTQDEAGAGLVAVRPPGHHATAERAMGFCLLNNIAIGAQHALTYDKVNRVAIVDYDVHHGNGTQDIFYHRGDVGFISMHQAPFYPGTGALDEMGAGTGDGATMNIPLPAGVGDVGYEAVFTSLVIPYLERFAPDVVLVSAGFDGHWRDPLAMMRLSLMGYATITRHLIEVAKRLCEGRIVFVLEGGYDALAVGCGMANVGRLLLADEALEDPYGEPGEEETPVEGVIEAVRKRHGL